MIEPIHVRSFNAHYVMY